MEMPEGWKNLNGLVDYNYSGPPSYERTNLIVALNLMKRMAEALDAVGVIYYQASSKMTEEDLKRPPIFRHDFTDLKIKEDHNIRAFQAIRALNQFMEWK